MSTAIVLNPLFMSHDTGHGHPERPARITAIEQAIENSCIGERLVWITPEPVSEHWLLSNHSPEYLARLERACLSGASYIDSPDSTICAQSYEVARYAAGGVLQIVEQVLSGKAQNGFAAIRPPGHHAEFDASLGFCLFNSIAIAARYSLAKHGLSRVCILDWDVHHGNGTQHSFEDTAEVFYCSLHAHPATLFPGTGYAEERGLGPGEGYTLNLPLLPGTDGAACEKLFYERVRPAIEAYQPELILISAGFDAHFDDPIGNLRFDEQTYRWLTRQMLELADIYCSGRLVSVLEGGYNLDALGACTVAHLEELLNRS